MILSMYENELITTALQTLKQDIPIEWKWIPTPNNQDFRKNDYIEFFLRNQTIEYQIEVKKELKNHQLHALIPIHGYNRNMLLIVEKLYPNVKKELRANHINYLEGNGNVYLENEQIFIFIDHRKTLKALKETGNRAFTKTGLKVVFHFLLNPEIINLPQREIAEITNVALGNIPQVINGLRETNFLLKKNKNEYLINDYRALLTKWISEYDQTLKPSIFKQRFVLMNTNQNWQQIELLTDKTVWGGEPAGDILTNHLRPEELTLYTKENTKELIQNYRIIPSNTGDFWVYEIFWNEKYNAAKTAPALLVYADLILKNDKRCLETANLIFDEYIQPNL